MPIRAESFRVVPKLVVPVAVLLLAGFASEAWAYPNTGVPINLHRRFVVQQTKRKAAQGQPTRRHVGVWLSGGYERTVKQSRYRGRRWRRR